MNFECDAYQICEREFENEEERAAVAQMDLSEALRRKENEKNMEQAKKELNRLVGEYVLNLMG